MIIAPNLLTVWNIQQFWYGGNQELMHAKEAADKSVIKNIFIIYLLPAFSELHKIPYCTVGGHTVQYPTNQWIRADWYLFLYLPPPPRLASPNVLLYIIDVMAHYTIISTVHQ